jgi:hypothetical protein
MILATKILMVNKKPTNYFAHIVPVTSLLLIQGSLEIEHCPTYSIDEANDLLKYSNKFAFYALESIRIAASSPEEYTLIKSMLTYSKYRLVEHEDIAFSNRLVYNPDFSPFTELSNICQANQQ